MMRPSPRESSRDSSPAAGERAAGERAAGERAAGAGSAGGWNPRLRLQPQHQTHILGWSSLACLGLVLLLISACGAGSEVEEGPARSSDGGSEDGTGLDGSSQDGTVPDGEKPEPISDGSASEGTVGEGGEATKADEGLVSIVFLGDSLTAGFGLDPDLAFPHLVEQALLEEGYPARVTNAGVSGDTTAGGERRLAWLLRQKPDILVVGLGANDGLRGQDLASSEASLRQILQRAKDAGSEVLLLGMLIPPNYGQDYADAFAAIYPRLASDFEIELVPFLLEGVAGVRELNQADGIHPTAEGQKALASTVLAYLRPMLEARS